MKKRMFSLALVMSMLLGMIVMPATAVSADDANALEGACPCGCGSLIEDIQWKVWNVNDDAAITTGHYYLEGDYVQTQQAQINSGNRVVLDLRGYKLTNVADHRMILCYGYMALMDSVGGGRLCGNTTGSGFGGVIMVSTNETMGSVFELYSGTITLDVNHKGSRRGGLITVADTCTFRMYGGTILGGTTYSKLETYADTKDDGGAIYVASGGATEILGGKIIGCEADRYGGAIYSQGTTVLKNCEIIGGYAEHSGGNICQNGGSLTIENARIRDGACDGTSTGGGNICVMSGAVLTVKDSVIRNGNSAYHGGNVYIGSGSASFENTVIEAGVAVNRGNNLYGATSAVGLTIKNCQLPGDIVYVGVNLTLEGLVKIGLLNNGLRIWYSDTARTIKAAGLSAGSEIYVDANGTFTDAGANLSYFKGAMRTVLTQSAEGIVATQAASGELGGYCPHCGQRAVWKAFNKTDCLLENCLGDKDGDTDPACTNYHIASGHYYLTASDSNFRQYYIGAVYKDVELDTNITTSSDDVVMDLAGYSLTSSGRGFYVREGGEGFEPSALTMLDSYGAGKVNGKGVGNQGGGVLYAETNVALTIYGGNYKYVTGKAVNNGGIIYTGGPLHIYGGTFNANAYENTASNGGAIYVGNTRSIAVTAGRFIGGTANEGGTLYCGYNVTIDITGGQFTDGTATAGGNIRAVGTSSYQNGSLNISGVSLTKGHSTTNGGNFCATYYKTYHLRDSYLADGSSDDYGGNIATGTNATFANYEDLIVYRGTAARGGNIYSAGTGARANFINCYVADGYASGYSGNFHGGNGYLVIQGGVYEYGRAKTYGGNLCANTGKANAANYTVLEKDSQGNAPRISGGVAGTYGGNIYVYGVLTLTDAFIHNGKAKENQGQDIWYLASTADHKAHKLTVGAGLRGDIIMASETGNLTKPYYGNAVKDTVCTTLNANITMENLENDPMLTAKNGALYVGSVAVLDGDGNSRWCASLDDAVEVCKTNEYVRIYADETVTLTKDCAIDLNGNTLTVSGAYRILGMDTVTDLGNDSTGKVILTGEASYAPAHIAPNGEQYLAIADGNTVTYHCLNMRITSVSLRPGNAGIYYNAVWHLDSTLAASIETFGVAVSLDSMPKADFMGNATVSYTVNPKTQFVSGVETQSAIVANILKQDATYNGLTGAAANDQRGQLKIYATPYVMFKNGEQVSCYVDENNVIAYSLRDILDRLGRLVEETPEQYRRYTPQLRNFYSKWKDNGLADWGLQEWYAFHTPAQDDVIDILMIGNSYCYYYIEELHEMAKAAGVKMRVCNLYYSGCPMTSHYKWWQTGEKKYQYFEAVDGGKVEVKGVSLEWALKQREWDVLSFQLSSTEHRKYTLEESMNIHREARNVLYGYLREQFPGADLYFHHVWSYEIGHTRDDGYVMKDLDQQIAYEEHIRQLSTAICAENNVARINTGDAWEIYRAACDAAGIAHNLTARLGKDTLTGEPHSGDGTHDGDIGGGQYLNACVWFEILTGLDCRDNTYVPTYTYDGTTYIMDETMRTMLQEAAHKAVTEILPTYPEYGK